MFSFSSKSSAIFVINFLFFLNNLDNKKYWIDYKIKGSCNYAFPVLLKTKDIKKEIVNHFVFHNLKT